MIDAYDSLVISLDADEEDIKKAYKRLSLQHHPDKVQASGSTRDASDAAEKFNEIKLARDILQDVERRKIYDTFGIDLGEERPEMEVWNIGLSTLLSPMGGFVLKTVVVRAAIWIIGFSWVGYILLLCSFVVAGLYKMDVSVREVKLQSPEVMPILVQIGLIDVVVLLSWIWPLLGDAVGVFYLVSEICGVPVFLDNWKIGAAGAVGSIIMARLFRGWWFWILGIEVVLALITLAALTVAAGIMRLWIDGVQAQRSEKLKEWRLQLRKERKKVDEEIACLKKKLEDDDRGKSGSGGSAGNRR